MLSESVVVPVFVVEDEDEDDADVDVAVLEELLAELLVEVVVAVVTFIYAELTKPSFPLYLTLYQTVPAESFVEERIVTLAPLPRTITTP